MSMEQKLWLAIKFAEEQKIHEIFNEIYNTYAKLVYFTISKYISNTPDIEDLTQEVFLKFFNNINKTEIRNIKYYLVTTAKNISFNYLRSKKIEFELDDRLLYEEITEKEESDLCLKIINKLKEDLEHEDVYIILQHVLYDKSFKDISKECGKKISYIAARYYRSINKIRRKGVK